MSRQDAFAFLRKSADDPELRRRLQAGGETVVLAIAKEEGFCVTLEELREVIQEIKGETDALSDDLLEIVAGGISFEDAVNWLEKNQDKFKSLYGDIDGDA